MTDPQPRATAPPLCTCGEPAEYVVAIEGLLCDEEGTTRTYTFCGPCGSRILAHYSGSEFVGRVDVT